MLSTEQLKPPHMLSIYENSAGYAGERTPSVGGSRLVS